MTEPDLVTICAVSAAVYPVSGRTAALLSARVGEQNVTSVEVDADVAQQAITNLEKAGLAPHVVVADGAAGFDDHALYERVHATVAVAEIPYAWVEQTRPGGVIVPPWQPLRGHGLMMRLTTTRDAVHGRFHGPTGYMMLRSHRAELVWQARHLDEADKSGTTLDPRTVFEAGPARPKAMTMRSAGRVHSSRACRR
ncbi:protein-L-isoaspartate O-methyltransferase [Actinomadura sp. 3N508]|uniref:protein-L-isoaspartate O-methyltransferase n=1 Tax=Actinomadura sp. 3N508 TaxID=3375153 RepID=UPI0037B7565F